MPRTPISPRRPPDRTRRWRDKSPLRSARARTPRRSVAGVSLPLARTVALGAALFLVIVGLGGSARAATGFPPSTNVVLFTPPYSDPLVARLEAELAAVGIVVRRLAMPPEAQLDAAITREITSGASAAIRVIPRSRGAEVWTGDTTARMLRRRAIRADTSDAALSVIALRTVEFLRASLLDVKRRGPATPGGVKNPGDQAPSRETATAEKATPVSEKVAPSTVPVPEAPAVRAAETSTARPTETPSTRPAEPAAVRPVEKPTAEPDEKPVEPPEDAAVKTVRRARADAETVRFEIAAGPAMVASPGGTSPLTSAAAMGRAWFTERAGMELMAVFPMVPSHLNNTEGAVEFRAAVFGGGAAFRLTPAGRWTADATLGVAALLFRASGSAVGTVGGAANQGRINSVWKAAAHARIGGGVEINRWLVLRADVLAGMTPSSRIILEYEVTDSTGQTTLRERATWGPTFAVATVGLQAAW